MYSTAVRRWYLPVMCRVHSVSRSKAIETTSKDVGADMVCGRPSCCYGQSRPVRNSLATSSIVSTLQRSGKSQHWKLAAKLWDWCCGFCQPTTAEFCIIAGCSVNMTKKRQIKVLHFPALRFGAPFSGLANSAPQALFHIQNKILTTIKPISLKLKAELGVARGGGIYPTCNWRYLPIS